MLLGVALTAAAASGALPWRDANGTVRDARYLEFQASPDHAEVDPAGVPLVRRYELEIFAAGATAPLQTIDLGKPSPPPGGVIRVALPSGARRALAPRQAYEAAVRAVGPYGSATSDRSNRFSFSADR